MSANPNKVTKVAGCVVFRNRATRLFHYVDVLSDAMPSRGYPSREAAEEAADAVPVNRFYGEIVRREESPQPAPVAMRCFMR